MRKNKGSLLLEALLSVVILSTCITLIIQSLTSSLRALTYSHDYAQALILAENKMQEFLLKGMVPAGLSESGEFPEPYEKYAYAMKTEALMAESQEGLNDLTLTIFWNSGRRKNAVTLETYILAEEEKAND